MELHDVLAVTPNHGNTASSCFTVIRVPGGWIYQVWNNDQQDIVREVFVPFNNEFNFPNP